MKRNLKFTTEEALVECRRWLAYLESAEEKSNMMQAAAKLAQEGKTKEARQMQQRANASLNVYDASRLRYAVEYLVEKAEKEANLHPPH